MSKINKIKLSGTTYDVEDANASKTVELTQAQYDALVSSGAVDPNTFYIITDAQAVDITEYWTSGQTQSAIDSAVSGKADYSAATVSMFGTETISSSQTAQNIVIIFPYTDGVYYISGGSSNMFSITSEFWIGYNDVDNNTWKSLSINNTGDTSAYTFTLTNDNFYFQTKGINRVRNLRIVLSESATVAFTYKRWADVEVAASTVIEETILPELSGKQDTLSAGTGIDITNNVISATGGGGGINSVVAEYDDSDTDGEFIINVNSGQSYSQIFKVGSGLTVTEDGDDVILSATGGGGSITIDPSLDTGSTNAVANSAITNNTLSGGVDTSNYFRSVRFFKNNGQVALYKRFAAINGNSVMVDGTTEGPNFSLVGTSAITTSITSGSTDSQVPSAKAVYDALGSASGGITSGEVKTMIDESISGKADSTDVYTKSETSGATEISNALAEKLDSSAYTPSIAYSAGSGINIDSANTISVSDVSHSGLTDGTSILLRNSDYTTVSNNGYENIRFDYYYGATNNKNSLNFKPITINGYRAVRTNDVSLNLVETSAVTSSMTSSSTDAQVPSAKCVYDTLGGLKLVKLTQTEYDNLSTKDSNTLYVIVN